MHNDVEPVTIPARHALELGRARCPADNIFMRTNSKVVYLPISEADAIPNADRPRDDGLDLRALRGVPALLVAHV